MDADSRERSTLLWSVFPVVFFVYARTSFPSVTGGDAGELLAEACQLGTAHPPGYPLFTLLVHGAMRLAAVLIPSWDGSRSDWSGEHVGVPGLPSAAAAPALTANVLSCGFAALAALLLALTVEEWNSRRAVPAAAAAGAYGAAGLFAFSPLTWEYSTGAEVFALNNLLVALLLYLTVRAARAAGPKAGAGGAGLGWALAGAFVSGLALSNQHTSEKNAGSTEEHHSS